jgi:WD40 repeat protein
VKVFYRNLGKEFSFTGHEKWVKRAAFIDKSTRVVSIGDDKKLKIWKVPQPDTEQVFYEEKNFNVRKIWISPRSGLLEAVCDKWKFETSQNEHQCVDNCSEHRETFYVTWDKSGKKSEMMKISSQWLTFAHVNKECTEILYAHRASQQIISEFNGDWDIKNTYVCVIDTQNKTKSRSNLIPGDISSFGYSNSGKFLIIGEWFKFTLIRYENLEIVQSIYAMPGEVLATVMDNEDSLLFAANHNTLKKFKYQPNEQELIADIDRKSYDIDYLSQDFRINLTFSEDWQYLFCIFERFLEIVHCDTFTTLLRIDQSYNGIIFNLNHTLFMYGNGITDIYSARSFQKMSNLGKSFSVLDGILSSTKKNMYLVAKDCIYKSENPLSASQLTFVGNYTFLPEFQNHVDKIFNKKCDEPYLDSLWLIEPVHINLLHIYSYFNLSEMLRLGITGNEYLKIPIINSRDGFSALTIAIEKKYHDSIEAIIKTIRRLVKQDTSFMRQILFQVIEESLIDLTSMSYLSLHKLLNDIYIYDTSGYLLNYCPPGIKVPVLSLSDNFFAEDVEFGYKMNEDTELGSSVVFKKSLMKFYMKVGSSKSLEFMNTLADCENPDIYDTPVIKEILQQKWSQVKWFMYGQSSLYITYLILLCLFTSFESCRSGTFLIAPFAISGILYLYELIFVFLGPLTYFTDFWNLIDTLRSILMISYSALIWSGYFEISFEKKEKERYMLAVLIFISWTRGITYFRINAATRYLIKLLFQVVLDIVPFMVILFYSAVAFGLIFRAFDSGSNSDFFPYLTESYNIIIGGWDNPTDPEFYSLILLLATLLNPVISLNLLVAILSDTFETVSRDQIVADSQEMAEMIVEIETLIFCNRKKNEKKFLHVMENDSADVEEELELNVLVKNVRSKVNYLNVELKDHHSALDRLEQRVSETTNGVRNTFNSFMNR